VRETQSLIKRIVRVVAALAMVGIGIMHFVEPEPFVRIVPAALPSPLALVYISGVFEILLGVGLLPQRTRRLSAFGLVALYLAVFPANINMAIQQIQMNPDNPIPVWAMWARLPFQLVFILVALWVGDVWPRSRARA
jgi:uncharacterized membrane protein